MSTIYHILNVIRKNQDPSFEVESEGHIIEEEQSIEEKSIYCFNCGVKLDDTKIVQYCPFCSTKIT